jgi:hypothetical protein
MDRPPLVLKATRAPEPGLMLGSIVWFFVGVGLGAFGYGIGWFIAVLALLSPSTIEQSLRRKWLLHLTADGFTVQFNFRSASYAWRDVTQFGITSWNAVGFNCAADYRLHRIGRAVCHKLFGWDDVLPDTFGYDAEGLAKLMNEWRSRYVQKAGTLVA